MDVDVEGESLVASDGERTGRWPVDGLRLGLGGCAEDRVVVHCPTGDTIISTDMNILNAFAQASSALSGQVNTTRSRHSAAKFRRRFSMVGVLLLWWGIPLTILGSVVLVAVVGIVMAIISPKTGDTAAPAVTEQQEEQQTQAAPTEEDTANSADEEFEIALTEHIDKYFHPPRKGKALSAQARFTIKPDGKVSNFSFTHSSGNKAFDQAAKSAVMSHQPLPAPPDPTRPLEIEYDF